MNRFVLELLMDLNVIGKKVQLNHSSWLPLEFGTRVISGKSLWLQLPLLDWKVYQQVGGSIAGDTVGRPNCRSLLLILVHH